MKTQKTKYVRDLVAGDKFYVGKFIVSVTDTKVNTNNGYMETVTVFSSSGRKVYPMFARVKLVK